MTLKSKPRNTATPYILDIYDADRPEGTPRIVARTDTRDGKVWRTEGSTVTATMAQIKAAIAA